MMKKIWYSLWVSLFLVIALAGCGNKDTDSNAGSIEEGRIIVNGATYTFNSDTFEQIEEKSSKNFDSILYQDTSTLYAENDAGEDKEASYVLFSLNESGTLSGILMDKGDLEIIDFSIGPINNKSSFHDILDFLGLLENGEYTPHDTREDGGFYSSHSLDDGECMVDWGGNSSLLIFDNKTYGYGFIIYFEGDSIYDEGTIAGVHITY